MKKLSVLFFLFCALVSSGQNNSGLIFSDFSNLEINSTDEILTKSEEDLPLVVDYSKDFQSEPFNQGSSGTCVACAVAHLLTYNMGQINKWDVNKHRVSPSFIYNMNHKQGDPAGLATYRVVPNVVSSGFLYENQMPFAPGDESRPGLNLQYEALKNRPVDWNIFRYNGGERNSLVLKSLINQQPLIMDIDCRSTNWSHCVCVVGYNDTVKIADKYTGGVMYLNSYGSGWNPTASNIFKVEGKNGYGWIPYEFIFNEENYSDWWFQWYFISKEINQSSNFEILRISSNWKEKGENYLLEFARIYVLKKEDTVSYFNMGLKSNVEKFDHAVSIMGTKDDQNVSTLVVDGISSISDLSIILERSVYVFGSPQKGDSVCVSKVEFFDKNSCSFENIGISVKNNKQSDYCFNSWDPDSKIPLYKLMVNIFKYKTPVDVLCINNINVYPNPTLGLVNVENAPYNSPVSVYDTNGRILFRKTVDNQSTQIDLSSFPSGLYFVKVQNTTKKIIKK